MPALRIFARQPRKEAEVDEERLERISKVSLSFSGQIYTLNIYDDLLRQSLMRSLLLLRLKAERCEDVSIMILSSNIVLNDAHTGTSDASGFMGYTNP